MTILTEEHGMPAMRIPLLLKMNAIATQLLMNEIQLCYWHALNISRDTIWKQKPAVVVDRLLVNALFSKINTCDPEQSEVFKTFIQHNYKEVMRTHWKDFSELRDCDQRNWLYFVHPKSADRAGKTLLNDKKIGLEQMKMLYESLFYKVKVDSNMTESQSVWQPRHFMFDQKLKLKTDNYKLIDHPADNFIDYNSMVDNLEEEHLRRDVFTTAIETTGQIINPSAGADEGSSQGQILKPSPRGDDFAQQ